MIIEVVVFIVGQNVLDETTFNYNLKHSYNIELIFFKKNILWKLEVDSGIITLGLVLSILLNDKVTLSNLLLEYFGFKNNSFIDSLINDRLELYLGSTSNW